MKTKVKIKNKTLIAKFLCASFILVGTLCAFIFGGSKSYAYEVQNDGTLVSQNILNLENSSSFTVDFPDAATSEILINEGLGNRYKSYVCFPRSYNDVLLDASVVFFDGGEPNIVNLNTGAHYETVISFSSSYRQMLQLYALNTDGQKALGVEVASNLSSDYSGSVAISFDYSLVRVSYNGSQRNSWVFYNIMISETSYNLSYEEPGASYIPSSKYTEDVSNARAEGYEAGARTSVAYSMFNGSHCKLYSNNNDRTVIVEDDFSSNDLNLSSISLDNYPAVSDFIASFNSTVEQTYGAYFYVVINFKDYASYNTPLTFNLNNTVVETSVSIYKGNEATSETMLKTYARELNNYQIYVNQDAEGYLYSFTQFVFSDLYLPDYGNFTVNVSADGLAYNKGYKDGVNSSKDNIYNQGYNAGKQAGYDEAINEDFGNNGFKTLIGTILSYPVNMIRSAFNFEIFGLNISSLLMFIASITIVGFVIKKFWK